MSKFPPNADWLTIKNEINPKANTATRVGQAGLDTQAQIDYLAYEAPGAPLSHTISTSASWASAVSSIPPSVKHLTITVTGTRTQIGTAFSALPTRAFETVTFKFTINSSTPILSDYYSLDCRHYRKTILDVIFYAYKTPLKFDFLCDNVEIKSNFMYTNLVSLEQFRISATSVEGIFDTKFFSIKVPLTEFLRHKNSPIFPALFSLVPCYPVSFTGSFFTYHPLLPQDGVIVYLPYNTKRIWDYQSTTHRVVVFNYKQNEKVELWNFNSTNFTYEKIQEFSVTSNFYLLNTTSLNTWTISWNKIKFQELKPVFFSNSDNKHSLAWEEKILCHGLATNTEILNHSHFLSVQDSDVDKIPGVFFHQPTGSYNPQPSKMPLLDRFSFPNTYFYQPSEDTGYCIFNSGTTYRFDRTIKRLKATSQSQFDNPLFKSSEVDVLHIYDCTLSGVVELNNVKKIIIEEVSLSVDFRLRTTGDLEIINFKSLPPFSSKTGGDSWVKIACNNLTIVNSSKPFLNSDPLPYEYPIHFYLAGFIYNYRKVLKRKTDTSERDRTAYFLMTPENWIAQYMSPLRSLMVNTFAYDTNPNYDFLRYEHNSSGLLENTKPILFSASSDYTLPSDLVDNSFYQTLITRFKGGNLSLFLGGTDARIFHLLKSQWPTFPLYDELGQNLWTNNPNPPTTTPTLYFTNLPGQLPITPNTFFRDNNGVFFKDYNGMLINYKMGEFFICSLFAGDSPTYDFQTLVKADHNYTANIAIPSDSIKQSQLGSMKSVSIEPYTTMGYPNSFSELINLYFNI